MTPPRPAQVKVWNTRALSKEWSHYGPCSCGAEARTPCRDRRYRPVGLVLREKAHDYRPFINQ